MADEECSSRDDSSEESQEANKEPVRGKCVLTVTVRLLCCFVVGQLNAVSCISLIKIRVSTPPEAAKAAGFTQNPIAYESFGKYTAKVGAKRQQPEMTEFEALQELLPRRLIELFQARAKAYFTENDMNEEYHRDGFWRLGCSDRTRHCAVFYRERCIRC